LCMKIFRGIDSAILVLFYIAALANKIYKRLKDADCRCLEFIVIGERFEHLLISF